MAEMRRNCELCDGDATTYCPSDNAFLCDRCDEKVHGANFLVARHVRSYVCSQCRNFGDGCRFSGIGVPHAGSMKMTCGSCSPHVEDDDGDALSSSSSCVSSTGEEAEGGTASASSASWRGKRSECHHNRHRFRAVVVVDEKVEGILVNWCMKMGVEDRRVVKMAVELVSGCMSRITVLPFRVLLAATFWVAIRLCCDGIGSDSTSTCHELKRVEQISGVPAKLILATESRLARVIRRRRSREDHEEGWAEC